MLNHPYAEQLLTDYARLTDGLNEQNEMEMLSSAKALSLLRRYVRHCCLSDKAEYSLLHMPYAKDILPFYLERWPLCEIANDKIQTMPYANEILA